MRNYICRLPFKHLINPGVVFVPLFSEDLLHMVAHLFLGKFALNIYSSFISLQYWTDLHIKCGHSPPLQLKKTPGASCIYFGKLNKYFIAEV